MITNTEIAKLLREVAAACVVKNESHFKIIAYERAADNIENSVDEVFDLYKEGKLNQVPGIGVSLSGYLEELCQTGKVNHFGELMKDLPPAMFPLLTVSGFGPKKAYKLVTILKLKDPKTVINDLEKAAKGDKIAKIESFGEKSQEDILLAINSYKKGQVKENRINLSIAILVAEKMIAYLKDCPACLDVLPLGSIRRKSPTVGDLDIAVATDDSETVINWFVSYPGKLKIIEKGPSGASLLLTNGRQVDLRVQKPEAYGAMLQYFTGSKNHNIHLRELALKRGLSLSEYGIKSISGRHAEFSSASERILKRVQDDKNTKEIYEFREEKDFYNFLGLDWIPPELREDTGEIEAALSHNLPKLVKLEDIRGDLHVHSSYPIEPSHDTGADSMEVILKKAETLQYEYLGFSEHSPSLSKHTEEQVYKMMLQRKKVIEQLKLTSKNVRVINLLEVDILANGNLSVDNKSLALIDGAIASIHSGFDQPKETMTKRILQALANDKVRILGHPTGRKLGKREPCEADWERIFNFCREKNKAVEINACPERLDLPDTLIRKAVEMGVKMVINTDSHDVDSLNLMQFGVFMAQRGWCQKSDILNTLGYNEFYKWLTKR